MEFAVGFGRLSLSNVLLELVKLFAVYCASVTYKTARSRPRENCVLGSTRDTEHNIENLQPPPTSSIFSFTHSQQHS